VHASAASKVYVTNDRVRWYPAASAEASAASLRQASEAIKHGEVGDEAGSSPEYSSEHRD